MNRVALVCAVALLICASQANAQKPFTLEQVMSAPFPANLTAAKTGNRIAWTLDEEGKRNVYVAEGPDFKPRKLTPYNEDDGGELGFLSFSPDANTLIYVRGEEKNPAGVYGNPTSNPAGAQMALWAVDWKGGVPRKIDEGGDSAQISTADWVAYTKDGQIYLASLDGSEKPKQIVARGNSSNPRWSPDGSKLAFVSGRGDHAFIAVYDASLKTVHFLQPSVDSDNDPAWSADGKRIAFVRQPAGRRDAPKGFFIAPDKPHPWAVWMAEAATGAAKEIWHSNNLPQGSFPGTADETGGGVLNWAATDQLVIASEEDGWLHLYALSAAGGKPKLLTPGDCEVEQWSFTTDRKTVLFNSNCNDVDRRHLWSVDITGEHLSQWTKLKEIDWSPVALSDGKSVAFITSGDSMPALPVVTSIVDHGTANRSLVALSETFPTDSLVEPQQVKFKSGDGLEIHAQLFRPKNAKAETKLPALIFLHGGPIRQMLLGWHYMFYYSNCYAMNQYLASRGYAVLALNYRSGIGYGRAYREAPGRAGRGATEYEDVVAAGKYLQSLAGVDAKHIGLWGGSYGGYLTALGLGRNSDLFAAGVDIHGVHDWPTDNWNGKDISPELTKLAHDSSPVTSVNTWKSPVLFIHGDDDRNVYFAQTVDLAARLRERGVEIEQLIFPDEIHDFLLHRNWLAAYHAASDFFDRHFKNPGK